MKINCVAIDDEPMALGIIRDYASKIPFMNLEQTFENPMHSIDYMRSNKTDLMLLDIQMEGLNGIQLLRVIKNKPMVIFTTAYDQYALDGFDLGAVDYLLKPFSFERFLKAITKAYEKLQLPQSTDLSETTNGSNGHNSDIIFIKTEFRLEKVNVSDILYIEGMSDYLRIVTSQKRLMTLMNFKKMEELLPSCNFCRVHKSYIVAISKIENIERNRIKIADKLIPISDTYKKPFFDFLSQTKLA